MAELESLGLVASAENPDPRELAFSDLSELTYLQAVIKVHRTSRATAKHFAHLSSGELATSDMAAVCFPKVTVCL